MGMCNGTMCPSPLLLPLRYCGWWRNPASTIDVDHKFSGPAGPAAALSLSQKTEAVQQPNDRHREEGEEDGDEMIDETKFEEEQADVGTSVM